MRFLLLILSPSGPFSFHSQETNKPFYTMPNPVVFFDITSGGQPAGRIEMTVREASLHA